jgi:hypothetical protein
MLSEVDKVSLFPLGTTTLWIFKSISIKSNMWKFIKYFFLSVNRKFAYISDQSSDEYLCGTCTKMARFSYRLVLQQICFTHSIQFFKGYKMA